MNAIPIYGAATLSFYYLFLSALACLGLHRAWLMVRGRNLRNLELAQPEVEFPEILVQLPIYNEPHVGVRVLRACAALDYPSDRLVLQVLDDSTDETTGLLAQEITALIAENPGLQIEHVRREIREGFKAGALADGLSRTNQPFIALFDADFLPPAVFLRRAVSHLQQDPSLAFVQGRWQHLERRASAMRRAQAALLDGHFLREHLIRSRAGLIFNFNGTAGVWRREAIEAAGGWQGDTLTEDFDLSYRAFMAGWRADFLPDLTAPAELPGRWPALRSQQARWTRGSLQCMRKLLLKLWSCESLPYATRMEGTIPLLTNFAWPVLLALMVLSFPVFTIRQSYGLGGLVWLDTAFLLPATFFFAAYYYGVRRDQRQGEERATPREALADALLAMLMGIALCPGNARAALQGLLGGKGVFVRTPKAGEAGRRAIDALIPRSFDAALLMEAALFLYLALLLAMEFQMGVWIAMPFTGLFLAGIGWSLFARIFRW